MRYHSCFNFFRQVVIFQPAVFISNIMCGKCTIKLNLDRCRCVDGSKICFHDKKKKKGKKKEQKEDV